MTTPASASPLDDGAVQAGARRWLFAAAGALLLGVLVTRAPRLGKPLAVLVVFSMLAAYARRGGRFPTL